MKIKYSIFSFLLIILLSGCATHPEKNESKKYTIEKECIEYVGHINSVNMISFTIDDETDVLVDNGEMIDAKTKLFSKYNSDVDLEIQKTNMNINNLKDDINVLQSQLDEEMNKNDLDQNLINEINDTIKEKKRSIDEMNIDLEHKNIYTEKKAPFSGQVIIKNNTSIDLYSNIYQVVIILKQEQLQDFNYEDTYYLMVGKENVGDVTLNSIVPCDENNNNLNIAKYEAIFDIKSEYKFTRDMIVDIKKIFNTITIPSEYVREKDSKYYIKMNGKQIEIKVEKKSGNYYILESGVNEGDVIESFGETDD